MKDDNTFYSERDCRLSNTDYVVKIIIEHQATSKPISQKYIDLIEYRQKLRDLPEQNGFDAYNSNSYEWPELP